MSVALFQQLSDGMIVANTAPDIADTQNVWIAGIGWFGRREFQR